MPSPSKIDISTAGIQFICNFEKFMPLPYRDSGGVPTIGYGTVIAEADAQKYAHGITKEQAMEMLAQHLVTECNQLTGFAMMHGLLQHQVDAIFSLGYNIGLGAFVRSTIYRQLSARANDLSPWLYFVKDAKGNTQQGLITRRAKELKLFIYAIY